MHDVVVVGAGHNGLVCAAYLARAGLDVCVVEARPTVGGCASTVDAIGARVNICNCDHLMVRSTPIVEELGLADHGLTYLDVDPVQSFLFWDPATAPWLISHSVEATLDSLARSHPGQVEGYRRYLGAATPVARLVLEMTGGLPTPGRALGRLAATQGAGLTTLLAWSRRTVASVLRDFFTSDALLAPVVTTGPAVWGLSPHTPGTGLGALGYAMKHLVPTGRPVGGSGALPDALARAVTAAGGTIRCASRVAEICCEGDRVRGVALHDGTLVEAPVVVAAGDPRDALVTWLRNPPTGARGMADRWRRRPETEGYESKLDAVVTGLPRLRGLDQVDDPLVATAIVSPTMEGIAAAHALLGEGRVAEHPLHYVNVPSVLDPTMAPGPGQHLLSLEALFTPYRLAGGWPGSGEPERWLANLDTLCEPGTLSVDRWRVVTPVDYESDFGMPRGYAPSFGGGPLAALLGRRDRELTRYETPVKGLYLCGAGTYPGAGIWGASGRNAAAVVLRARSRRGNGTRWSSFRGENRVGARGGRSSRR